MIFEEWSDFDEEVDVLSKLPPNFAELRESKKWQERKEALEALLGLLENNYPRLCTKTNYGEIASNLQQMLKSDANINCSALVAKCITGLCKGLRKKFAPYTQSIFAVAIEKLKEKKVLLRDPVVDCMDALANTLSSIDTLQEEIINGMSQKNPQIKQGVDMFIYRQMNLLTGDKAPKKLIKAIGPSIASHFGDADGEVREASFHAAGAIQRLIGEKNLKTILGDVTIEEAKAKKITECAEKAAAVHSEIQLKLAASAPQATTSAAPAAASGSGTAVAAPVAAAPVKEIDPFDMLDPVDVLEKLPEDFQTNIESKKWTERRDALQAFLNIMEKFPKLDPKANYGDMVATLKRIIEKDANINVAALAAKCLKGVADGLRKKFAQHAPSVIPAILEKFKEKKPTLRDPLVEAIDAVYASINLESIQDDLTAAMEKANPNIKIQTDLFLYRAFKLLDAVSMPKKTLKALAPLLVKHTGDSDPEVRDASHAALGSAMRAVGEKPFLPLLADIVEDKNKMSKIKEFYQKCLEEVGTDIVQQMVQSVHKADPPPAAAPAKAPAKKPVLSRAGSTANLNGNDEEDDESLKPPAGGAKKPEKKVAAKPKEAEEEPAPEEPPKAKEVLSINDGKQQRIKDEKTLKILKWNFATPTEEHLQQLQQLIGQEAKISLSGQLFHKDFKMHMKAIETLLQLAETTPEALVKNSDLLLKWCTLRFFETNPAVLKMVLDLAKTIILLVAQFEEPLSTEEINAFVPYLLSKSGEPKENFRVAVKEIIEAMTDITGPLKLTPLVIDALKTKNARQRAECLTMLENYIIRGGVAALKSTGIHKSIAACIADRDNGVRNAAINGLVACYREEGDQMWRNAGKLADKDRAMVEERIKRTGAAPGSAKPLQGYQTPVRGGGAKVVVPPSAGGTVVRRPNSRSRLPVSEENFENDDVDDTNNRNETFDGRGRTVERPNGIRPSTSRYAIDEDFVELTGVHALPSTQLMNEVDSFVPKIPSQPIRPPTTPMKRSGSSSSISSLDTYDQLDKVIQNISSGIPQVAIEAMESIIYMLQQGGEQKMLVEERVSLVLQAIATQFSLIRQIHRVTSKNGSELMKYIINVMNGLTTGPVVRLHIEEQAMTDWLAAIIPMIAESNALENVDVIKKSLNITTIRVCTRAEPTIFVVSTIRCLCSSLLQDPHSSSVELFTKCVYKWMDILKKQPQPLRPVLFLEAVSEMFHKLADSDEFTDHIRAVELTMEVAINIMGDALQDAVRRVPNVHPKVVSFINVFIRKLQEQDPNWVPKLPGVVAEEPPKTRSSRTESTAPARRELHILVDNCIRDLASVQNHAVKLVGYLSANPDEENEYNNYTAICFLGATVRKFVAATKEGRAIPPVTDQDLVSMAQRGQALKTRMAKVIEKRPTGTSAPSNVLQNRDINQESFSGPLFSELPVPSNLLNIANNSPTKEETRPARKGRRSIDPAVYNAIQAKLSNIGDV